MRSKKKSKNNKRRTRCQKGGEERNKLVVVLSDGLANRIFQIMAGLGFAEKWNMDLFILNSGRNHISSEASKNDVLKLFPTIQFIDDDTDFSSYTKISEPQQFVFHEIENPNKNTLLSGYYQTDKYFPKIQPKLKLTEPENSILKNIDTNKLFYIHFRFGDYNTNGFKLNLDNYYKLCINKIKEEYNDAIFLIVSNSKSESENYINTVLISELKDIKLIYDNDTNETRLDSLYYMSQCKGGICSNSTFSWIGAYTIENKSKHIYMPSPWLSWINGTNDIYPTWATVIDINLQKGGENQSAKLIIKNGFTHGGFFSEFVKMLAYLEDNKNITEIEYNILATRPGAGLPFISENEELFSKVFMPYNENKPIDTTIVAENYKYQQYTYRDAYNNYNENHYKLQGLHDTFVKYIKIKPEILEKVEHKYNEIKNGFDILVGIFVRSGASGDEQPSGKLPTHDDYIKAVNNLDKTKKIKYFLRVDNEEDLEFYKSALTPNYYSEMKRSSTNKLNSLHRSGDTYMTLNDLEDILVDVLLLSKCDILIHSVSNMATTSLLLNMNQQSICVLAEVIQNGGSNNIELIFANTPEQRSGVSSLLNQLMTFLVDNPSTVKIKYNVQSFGQGHPMSYINEGEEIFSKLFEPYDENIAVDKTIVNERYEDQRITGKNAVNYYNENRTQLQPFHDAYVKYIKIKSDLQEKIDSKIKELKSDAEQIISIFIRSNALAGEQPNGKMPTREEYDDAISKIDKSNSTKYFFCIDNEDDLEYFKNKYTPNYYTNIRRISSKLNGEPHTNTMGTLEDLHDSFIEVVLLASSDYMIHCISNMATAALYMNMNLKSIFITNQTGGNNEKAYVINLDKRPEKWERIQTDFKDTNIKLERFKAIEHDNGHVGCGESFKALIRMAKEQNMGSILILEDDCKPLKNFTKRWQKIKHWLDTNKDKWDIFSGGVRYPQNQTHKYDIDTNNKLFTTKGGNYTHFMYFQPSGYDAVLNWEHSKNGLFDYYINSYEVSNFLYVDPPIAIQYSGYSNTNKGHKNYESDGWVFTKTKESNELPNNNNNKSGGNHKKRKTFKKKKGGNQNMIPFIFVHLGEEFFPEWIEYAFKQCKLWNPDNTIYFICSSVHLSKFDNTLVTHIDLNALNKTEHHKQYDIDVPVDNTFRNGFYRFSTERIFVLEDFCIQNNIKEFIHLENDNTVYFSVNKLEEVLRNSVNGIAAPVLSENEISFGILYCNNIDALIRLSKFLLEKKSGSQNHNGDMIRGGEFFSNNKDITSYLPSIPLINHTDDKTKNKIANNIDIFKGIFDPAQYGVWLGGTDLRNEGGMPSFTSTNPSNIITADKFTYELRKESNNLQRYHIIHKEKGIDLPIFNLHIHSKKLQDFYFPKQNGGRKFKKTRKIKKQKGGSKSIFFFLKTDTDYKVFSDYLNGIINNLNKNGIKYDIFIKENIKEDLILSKLDGVFIFIEKSKELFLQNINDSNIKKSYVLNTEQLSIDKHLSYIIDSVNKGYKIIDYSLCNINILNKNNINNVIYLPYLVNNNEIKNIEKVNEIGIITPYSSDNRKDYFNFVKDLNLITINPIEGFNDERDNQLFKNKILLNIHYSNEYNIYESIRCDRAIFNNMIVLSEKSDEGCIPSEIHNYIIEFNTKEELKDIIFNISNNFNDYYNNVFKNFNLSEIEKIRLEYFSNFINTIFKL